MRCPPPPLSRPSRALSSHPRRTHLSDYRYGNFFGRSGASILDERLELDTQGTGAIWAREDGSTLICPGLPPPADPRSSLWKAPTHLLADEADRSKPQPDRPLAPLRRHPNRGHPRIGPDGQLPSTFPYGIHPETGERISRYTNSQGAATTYVPDDRPQVTAQIDPWVTPLGSSSTPPATGVTGDMSLRFLERVKAGGPCRWGRRRR
ncbi:hypothetical protein GCM10010272_34640 [Streptomyces lateritius]|nr:hypothetical protein GCM10010272_34640 [Streptomyces lateritius]